MHQFVTFLSHHWLLAAAFVLVMILIFMEEAKSQYGSDKVATSQTVTALLNKDEAVVVDLRGKEAFQKGHIIHAMNIPGKQLLSQVDQLSKHKEDSIVLACARGHTSPGLAGKLRKQGFKKVLVLKGGMAQWRADHMPLVKGDD